MKIWKENELTLKIFGVGSEIYPIEEELPHLAPKIS